MNQELENQLSRVIEKALNVAELTGEFVIDQAPILLQEFYNWHVVSDVMLILLGIGIILFGRYTPYVWLHKEKKFTCDGMFFRKYGESTEAYALFYIGLFAGISTIIVYLVDILKIIIAPKLYLLEYFV